MNKKNRTKKGGLALCVFAIIWIIVGCGSSSSAPAGTPRAAVSVGTQATTPAQQARAWKDGPGYAAFQKVQADMAGATSVTDLTPVQVKRLIHDVKAAEAYPVPLSVDPGGYYLDALIHLHKGLIAIKNYKVFDALVQIEASASSAKHFKSEVKQLQLGEQS